MSKEKFVNEGLILFFDVLVVAAGNWIFWLIISTVSTTTQVGQATSIISLVWMTTSIIQLGLEYPLLKFSEKSRILVSILIFELILVAAAIPIFLYALDNIFTTTPEISLITILIVVFLVTAFVSRFSLLGISKVKTVLIVDSIGTTIKFVTGYFLVSFGFGLIGILIPFILVHLTISIGCLIAARKSFEFKVASFRQIKKIIGRGLYNAPGKFSRMILLSLVVVLLASFGLKESDIGIFYIALMISYIAAGGIGTSISFMVIPASSKFKVDLSSDSLKIGLSLTVPLIAALFVAPWAILSLVGPEYSQGGSVLRILSIGIFPFIIMLNAISKLNNLNKTKELIVIGVTQISTFFVSFIILVPQYETLGAAYSILIAFTVCSIPSIYWLGKKTLRFISLTFLAMIVGMGLGYTTHYIFELHPIITIVSSMGITIGIIFLLKVISLKDIKKIMKNSFQKNE